MLRKFLIIITLIILILSSCGCFDNDNKNNENEKKDDKFRIFVEKVEISKFFQDIGINLTTFEFDFKISWKNLPVNFTEITFKIEFFSNDESYFYDWSRWILSNMSENTLEKHKEFIHDEIIPIPEKYRIELYWRSEGMDHSEIMYSVEKVYNQ